MAFVLSALLVATVFGTLAAQRMFTQHRQLARASMHVRIELSLGHLWLEEFAGGDTAVTADRVLEHNQRAHVLADAMLDGGVTHIGPVFPHLDEHMRGHIAELIRILDRYDGAVLERHQGAREENAGAQDDQRIDAVFREALVAAERIEEAIDDRIVQEARSFYVAESFSIAGVLVLVLIGLIGLGRTLRDRRKHWREREELLGALKAKNDELESIFYAASHDLRSPLVNVMGFAEELRLACGDLRQLLDVEDTPPSVRRAATDIVDKDIEESLYFISKNTSQMDVLLKGLLRLSRLGRAALQVEPLDVNAIVSDVIDTLAVQISKSDAELEIQRLPYCMGDAVQIAQLFANLIDNAIKYRSPDRPCRIRISATPDDDTVVYCVADNGVGMAESHQSKAFEIFHRLDPGGPVAGEGLGLTIVERIVGRLRGDVWVESREGEGCSLFVRLPAAP